MIASEYEPQIVGGLGIVATELTKQLVRREHQMIVITLDRHGSHVSHDRGNPYIIRFPAKEPYYVDRQWNPTSVLQELKDSKLNPDVVHVHSVQGMLLANELKKRYRIPVFYTSHSIGRQEISITGARRTRVISQQEELYRIADKIIVPSNMEKKIFQAIYPKYKKKVEVIPNGVHLTKTSRERNEVPYSILYVGRLSHTKGLMTVIYALPEVIKRQKRVALHVIGDRSGSYKRKVEWLIRRLKIEKHVSFYSWKDNEDLQKYYRRASIVVVPSLYDSFGLVPIEALNQGTPVIVSDQVGVGDYFSRSVVMKVKAGKPKDWSRAMIALLSHSDERKKRGKKGQRSLEAFKWHRVTDQYSDLFRQFINR